jgi:pyruvate dehydrogenase E2 component (dihydrolipoamide acetyltransferase)
VAAEIRVPPLGQTSNEMVLVLWYKDVGDTIDEGQPLFSVETDKTTVDVEAATSGTLLQVLAEAGDAVEAGTVVAFVGAPGEVVTPAPAQAEPPASPAAGSSNPAPGRAAASADSAGGVQALPAVRQFAREQGVDLSTVTGSGPGGRIERTDVIAAAAGTGAAAPAAAAASAASAGDLEPVPPSRAAMARRLVTSVQTIPQFTVTIACDVSAAQAVIAQQRSGGVRIGLTHIATRALARALREHPNVNRLWVDEGPALRRLSGATVGIAVAVDGGILVVSISDADHGDWADLAATVDSAVERARSRAFTAADQQPAAVTLSNLGMHDVDAFRAIIDPDQTAIAALGSMRTVPAYVDGELVAAERVVVNLTCDHRVVDGVDAARFGATFRGYLEDPFRLLAPALGASTR